MPVEKVELSRAFARSNGDRKIGPHLNESANERALDLPVTLRFRTLAVVLQEFTMSPQ
jgi:hypothetical protein